MSENKAEKEYSTVYSDATLMQQVFSDKKRVILKKLMKDADVAGLAKYFNTLDSLNVTTFELEGEPDGKLCTDGQMAELVANALKDNTTVKRLRFSDAPIGDIGAKAIADLLSSNHCAVDYLEFSLCGIGPSGAKYLASMLGNNTTLRTLCIAGNPIGFSGMIYLSGALINNKNIKSLDLTGNNISDAGNLLLAEILKSNESLERITIRESNMGSAAAKAIAQALETNKTIKDASFWMNGIGDDSANEFYRAFCINRTLKKVEFCSESFTPTGALKVASSLEINATIIYFDMDMLSLKEIEKQKKLVLYEGGLADISTLKKGPIDAYNRFLTAWNQSKDSIRNLINKHKARLYMLGNNPPELTEAEEKAAARVAPPLLPQSLSAPPIGIATALSASMSQTFGGSMAPTSHPAPSTSSSVVTSSMQLIP